MKRVFQILAVGLLLVIATGAVFATGQGERDRAAPRPTPMRYAVPGSPSQDHDTVIAAVNERLLEDGVPIEVEVTYIPWDAWDQRTNIMLSTGEPFELFHVMENRLPTQVFAGRGALTPLDDLLNEHGPVLQELTTDDQWEQMKHEGDIYSVPAIWREMRGKGGFAGGIQYRADLFEKYDLSIPETPEELIEVAVELQRRVREDTGETWYIWDHELQAAPYWHFRAMDGFPFYVDPNDEVIHLTEDGQASGYYETEVFREAARIQRAMYTAGVRHPDVLSLPRDMRRQDVDNAKALFMIGTGPSGNIVRLQEENPDLAIGDFKLRPDRPILEVLPVWNSNSVPVTTDTPEAGIKFLNWLYTSETNHDLFVYGVEGVHWTDAEGDIFFEQKRTESGAPYSHPIWQIGRVEWRKFAPETPQREIDVNLAPVENVVNAPNVGFVFDSSAVASEYANVLAEREASMYPIKWGVVAYEDAFDDAIRRIRAAGLDRIVEEYQRQYDEWRATR